MEHVNAAEAILRIVDTFVFHVCKYNLPQSRNEFSNYIHSTQRHVWATNVSATINVVCLINIPTASSSFQMCMVAATVMNQQNTSAKVVSDHDWVLIIYYSCSYLIKKACFDELF